MLDKFVASILLAVITHGYSTKITAQSLIQKYSMQPHVEGGWFVENYRSSERHGNIPDRYGVNATRSFGTHIYYILEGHDFSSFHRLKSDETWHFYAGVPLTVFVIDQVTGNLTRHHLGRPTSNFFVLIKRGDYYAARLRYPAKGKFSLVGGTVFPGFEYDDFEMSKRKDLLSKFPQHRRIIKSLTRI